MSLICTQSTLIGFLLTCKERTPYISVSLWTWLRWSGTVSCLCPSFSDSLQLIGEELEFDPSLHTVIFSFIYFQFFFVLLIDDRSGALPVDTYCRIATSLCTSALLVSAKILEINFPLSAGLCLYLMRIQIRIRLLTLMQIRIMLFTLMRIRIRLFCGSKSLDHPRT